MSFKGWIYPRLLVGRAIAFPSGGYTTVATAFRRILTRDAIPQWPKYMAGLCLHNPDCRGMTVEYSHRAEPVLDPIVELLQRHPAYELERNVCSVTRMAVQTRNSTARVLRAPVDRLIELPAADMASTTAASLGTPHVLSATQFANAALT
jgi:hypothetical protein